MTTQELDRFMTYAETEVHVAIQCCIDRCYKSVDYYGDDDWKSSIKEDALSRKWTMGEQGPLCPEHSYLKALLDRIQALENRSGLT